MTISNELNRIDATSVGGATYPYTFKIFADSDLTVIVTDTAGVSTTKVLTADYSVTGAGLDVGGTVVFVVAPTAGHTVSIIASVPLTQTTDLVNETGFFQDRIETALDRTVRMAQVAKEIADRGLRLPEGEAGSDLLTVLPAFADRAGRTLAFDATTGQPMATATATSAISSAMQPVAQSATLELARASMGIVDMVVSVKAYGAKGDNFTDDTAAIKAAADALVSGQTLYFPPGTYLVSHTNAGYQTDFGKKIIYIQNKTDITIRGENATIKCVNHDIGTNGGLMFIWGEVVQRLTVEGLFFDMTFTGTNTTALLYPYVGAIAVIDTTPTGVKAQSSLSSDIAVRDCTFKLFHPWGQYVTTSAPYAGDPNNGYKMFSVFIYGDYLAASYANQNRNATVERLTFKEGHNAYGAWVWSFNNVRFLGLRAEAWVSKRCSTVGAFLGYGTAMIRYHQFLCSGVEVSGCDFRAKPSSERGTAGFEGNAVFAVLDTNQTGDYSHGKGVVTNNKVQLSNGDATNAQYDYGVEVFTYGDMVISNNQFDGDASATNAYGTVGIYLAYEPVGGDGKASVVIDGNTFGASCSYMNNIQVSNGSNTSEYARRLKLLIVSNNVSHSQAQYFLDMTSNSAATYKGVRQSIIQGNIVIGTYNTLWNSASANSRAFQLGANQSTDILEVRDNIVRDKYYFAVAADVHASADVIFENNRRSGVTTMFSGGSILDHRILTGTFVPTIVGTTTAGVGTYTTQLGRYTRIGNRVFFDIILVWTAHTGTGAMNVSALPVTSSAASIGGNCSVVYSALVAGAGKELGAQVLTSSGDVTLYAQDVAGGARTAVAIDTAASLYISGSYEVV